MTDEPALCEALATAFGLTLTCNLHADHPGPHVDFIADLETGGDPVTGIVTWCGDYTETDREQNL